MTKIRLLGDTGPDWPALILVSSYLQINCMKPILCVIDMMDTSAQILEVAGQMALAYKTSLNVLYPYRLIDSGFSGDVAKLKVKLEGEANQKFAALQKKINALQQVSCEFKPQIGFPEHLIQSQLKLNNVGMIIVGQAIGERNGIALQELISAAQLPCIIIPDRLNVANVLP